MNVPIVWVMGSSGSGRSTLSENIVQKYGFKLVDPDAMVNKEIEAKTEKGNQFAAQINEGKKVPLADIIPLVEKEIMGNRGGVRGFVFDGYPQNQADAKVLEDRIGPPDAIFALEVGQETLNTRNSDRNAASLINASLYSKNCKPVLDKYADKTHVLDAERDAKTVFEEVVPKMDKMTQTQGGGRIVIAR